MHDTQSINYNYLDITFSNALYNATRYYHKEYEMKDSRLTEKMAVYEELQIKNGVMQQAILK